jgi:hypothetical protein
MEKMGQSLKKDKMEPGSYGISLKRWGSGDLTTQDYFIGDYA